MLSKITEMLYKGLDKVPFLVYTDYASKLIVEMV